MLVRLALERRVLVLRLVSVHRVWVPPERVQHRGQALVARVLGAVARQAAGLVQRGHGSALAGAR